MPRSMCDTCCHPEELARSVGTYRAAELLILCNILSALNASSPLADLTLLSDSGLVTTSGDNVIVTGVADNHICVYAYSLITEATAEMLALWQDESNVELWRHYFQAPTDVTVGANLAVTPPGYIFKTPAGDDLVLNMSTADDLHVSISYFLLPA